MTEPVRYYVVARLYPWTSFSATSPLGGTIPLTVSDGSCGVMLVYATREAAEAAADGYEVFRMVVGSAAKEQARVG